MAQEIDSLRTLLYEQLKDLYDAEKQLTKALPKMAKKAASEDLQQAFEEHLDVTNGQVTRLERVFELLDQPAKSKTCNGMKGLIEEGKEAMEEDAAEPFGDAALIAAAQKVEHYEIAAYGTVRTMAEMLGNDEAARLLEETLEEEKEADENLTEISERLLQEHGQEEESVSSEEEEEMQPARMTASKQRGSTRSQPGTRRRKAS